MTDIVGRVNELIERNVFVLVFDHCNTPILDPEAAGTVESAVCRLCLYIRLFLICCLVLVISPHTRDITSLGVHPRVRRTEGRAAVPPPGGMSDSETRRRPTPAPRGARPFGCSSRPTCVSYGTLSRSRTTPVSGEVSALSTRKDPSR